MWFVTWIFQIGDKSMKINREPKIFYTINLDIEDTLDINIVVLIDMDSYLLNMLST